jgi:hypothetical protein
VASAIRRRMSLGRVRREVGVGVVVIVGVKVIVGGCGGPVGATGVGSLD